MKLDVAFTPDEVGRRESSGVCVVVDVLRASSSIVTAFWNGCAGIYPVMEPSEAFPLADGREILACGESNGVKIAGYHLGNSPQEFSRETVAGKRLVMCTTNGTKAVRAGGAFRRTFIGCFLNAPAVASGLRKMGEDVIIVCAGREGHFSIEDSLCAGTILSELEGEMSDAAVACATLMEQYQERTAEVLLESQHGRFLQRIGFAEDIAYCSRVGVTEVVPEVFPSEEPAPYELVIKGAADAKNLREGKND